MSNNLKYNLNNLDKIELLKESDFSGEYNPINLKDVIKDCKQDPSLTEIYIESMISRINFEQQMKNDLIHEINLRHTETTQYLSEQNRLLSIYRNQITQLNNKISELKYKAII